MKPHKLLMFAVAVMTMGCERQLKEEILQTHPDGSKKTAVYYYGRISNLRRVSVFYPDGNIQSDHFFTIGKSSWGKPPRNEILSALGIMANVFSDSMSTIYHPNGQKRSQVGYFQGVKKGPEISWYENGQKKSETTYSDNGPEGNATVWFENGNISSEVQYVNGQKEGVETIYYPSGNKAELTTYSKGNRNGVYQEWYSNGNLKKEEHYTNNILDGTYTTFHDNGNKEEEGNYKMGKLDGDKKAYNKSGKLTAKATFIDGVFESGQSY